MYSWLDGQLFSHIKATIGDKIYWRLFVLKELSDVLLTSRVENKVFPPPSPLCNVVPLFMSYLQTTTNTPTLKEGESREVWILLFSVVTLFEYNVSTIILSPIVAKGGLAGRVALFPRKTFLHINGAGWEAPMLNLKFVE